MKEYIEAERQDLKRRRRERYLIISLFAVISFFTYLFTRGLDLGPDVPLSSSILVFALININVILLLLLLFLTVRNLVKLLFERRKNIMGAKLRTKLVLAFVGLTFLPTIIIFFASVQFISWSLEYWFNLPVEQSLKKSLEVGQDYYTGISDELVAFGNNLSRLITYEGYMIQPKEEALDKFIDEKRKEYGLASLKILSSQLLPKNIAQDHRIDLSTFKAPEDDILRKSLGEGADTHSIQSSPHGDLVSGIVPIFSGTESKEVVGLIVLSKFIPGTFVNRLESISRGLPEYRQLKMFKRPFKVVHMTLLSSITFIIILLSVWFGFYLSRQITIPIKELADGTNRIASGDYDFTIDLEAKDEIGSLVNSFNKMTTDLKVGKNKLEEAYQKLITSNVELEQRRLYMEIILANVAAGVISADTEGKILTINKSAERMLRIQADEIIGKNYKEILSEKYVRIIKEFQEDEKLFKKGFLEKQIKLQIENEQLTLLVSLNVLQDDHSNYIGLVAVFEDLSEIEKAQRMAAWREVARRIAHEVKNPLTPIQLSAQRLKKRYGEKLDGDEEGIFQECTEMIIKQVEELRTLVNEFSNFARMPASNPVPSDIRKIVKEALSLYKEANKDIKFVFKDLKGMPSFNMDREQMKRVIINLLDNSIEAIDGDGEIAITLDYDKTLQIVRIEVADNGRGIPPEDQLRMFEPYFSTKKQGTGLGLAIVNTIITDHNGFIRVQENKPKGTRFIIELPART